MFQALRAIWSLSQLLNSVLQYRTATNTHKGRSVATFQENFSDRNRGWDLAPGHGLCIPGGSAKMILL